MNSFFKDTIEELKKLQIPSKKEVYFTTMTIIVFVIVVSLLITTSDFVISKLISTLFGL